VEYWKGAKVMPHDRLRDARKKRKLTMQALADLVGTSNQQIARLEKPPTDKDHRKLTKEWAEKLAPHLDLTPQQLLFGEQLSTDVDKSNEWRRFELAPLKLVGYVEAGAWRDISSSDFSERRSKCLAISVIRSPASFVCRRGETP
jgi:transcriptional regulator with XRE-family HTH domain